MNLKQKVPKEFHEEALLANVAASEVVLNVTDCGVKAAPFMGRSLSTPDSLRPAKSVIRKSCRPKVGTSKSETL